MTGGASAQPSQNESQCGESLQDIVRDLMLAILERYPGTLDEETISY